MPCIDCEKLSKKANKPIKCALHSMPDLERLMGMRKLNNPRSKRTWGHSKKR